MRGSDAEVARDRQLRAAAHRIAVERGDDGKRELANLFERGLRVARHFRGAVERRDRCELAQIAARREALVTRASQNGNAQIEIVTMRCEHLGERSKDLGAERVALVGAVDGDAQDAAARFDLQV